MDILKNGIRISGFLPLVSLFGKEKKIVCFWRFGFNWLWIDQPNTDGLPLTDGLTQGFLTLWWYKSDTHSVETTLRILNFDLFLGEWHAASSHDEHHLSLMMLGGEPQLLVSPAMSGEAANTLTTILDLDKHSVFHFRYSIL